MRFFLALMRSSLMIVGGALVLLFGLVGVVVATERLDGPSSLLLWAGVAVVAIGGFSLLVRGLGALGAAEKVAARESIRPDVRRESGDLLAELGELLRPIVDEHQDSLLLTYRSTQASHWDRAVDHFYEETVFPRVLDQLPERRFRRTMARFDAADGVRRASRNCPLDAGFKARAKAWIKDVIRAAADPPSEDIRAVRPGTNHG